MKIDMEDRIIESAMQYTRKVFEKEGSGHDFWHTLRVYNNAMFIAKNENCNVFLVKLAALLHDVDDTKIFGGTIGQHDNAKSFMMENGCDSDTIERVCKIIDQIYFNGKDTQTPNTIEGKIIQDADWLDAMGAVGIARTFTFGGNKNRAIYNPDILPKEYVPHEAYDTTTTINFICERLLKLKDLMNTNTGAILAEQRHRFIETYLEEFFDEFNGEK